VPDLENDIVAVEIDEVDCEAHSDGVDGFAGDDPHAFSGCEGIMTQEALAAFATVVCYIDSVCQLDLAGDIRDTNGPALSSGPWLREPTQYSLHKDHY
jgi:hypothetical protein